MIQTMILIYMLSKVTMHHGLQKKVYSFLMVHLVHKDNIQSTESNSIFITKLKKANQKN